MTAIGIIGGSGLYELEGLRSVQEVQVDTPFGATSDLLVKGELDGTEVVFIPRHGRGHRLLPQEIPYRANVYALKTLGVKWVISASAVGSMRENIPPGDVVLPNQFIDRTWGRPSTFFGEGIVAHVSAADPVCPILAATLADSVEACDINCHRQGTYICMQGPAFSTRGESLWYRQAGVDIIGMTAMPEVKLAREAELRYATLALVTDYDCWHEDHEDVSVETVIQTLKQNTENVKRVLAHVIPKLGEMSKDESLVSPCDSALQYAIMTAPELIPQKARETLAPIIDKYLAS